MKILHTADWHIGKTLYRQKKRYEEFAAFLSWLADKIQLEKVDTLLVAGDVFDTTAPSNRAQELYYRFLRRVADSCCRHVVVTAGNHDSPSFLDAPREILKAFDVHVVGSVTENPEDEVLVLHDAAGAPELIVCAVPYLRDRDIRTAEAGESIDDKGRKLVEGIKEHYVKVAAVAEQKRAASGSSVPIVAMGHLFAAGGETVDGDGVRELYVGQLAHVSGSVFPQCFDYVALGHLHVPQKVNGSERIRYSGSPLPMGFGEARQQKVVCLVEFGKKQAKIETHPVPVFQQLESIKGDWEHISARIQELAAGGSRAWLEIVYEGEELLPDLQERADAAVAGTGLEVLAVKNRRAALRVLEKAYAYETLDDLDEYDVFERCLAAQSVPEEQRFQLKDAYREIVRTLKEE